MNEISKLKTTNINNVGNERKSSNVITLMPNKLSWQYNGSTMVLQWFYNGSTMEIIDDNKLIATLLRNNIEIAIIRAPFHKNNQTHILHATGKVKWNVRDKIKSTYDYIIFSDVYYIGEILFFFINTNKGDYRFSFDTDNGSVGNPIQSC